MDRDESAQLAELLTETEKEAAIAASDARGETLGAVAPLAPEIFHLFEYPWDINRRKEEGATAEMWAEVLPYAALLYPAAIPYVAAAEGLGLVKKVREQVDEPAAEELGVLAAISQVFDRHYIPRSLMGALTTAAVWALGSDLTRERGEHWLSKAAQSELVDQIGGVHSGSPFYYNEPREGALSHLADNLTEPPVAADVEPVSNRLTGKEFRELYPDAPNSAVQAYLQDE